MKKLAFLLIPMALFVGCYADDNTDATILVSVQDAVNFENQKNYVVGDTLFFEVAFSRYLPEEGFTTLLDIYETTDAEAFFFAIDLQRFSDFSSTYEFVDIAPEFLIAPEVEDSDTYGFFSNELVVVLDNQKENYRSRLGIILPTEGEYRLNLNSFSFYPPYNPEKVQLRIDQLTSSDTILDSEFTVSEE